MTMTNRVIFSIDRQGAIGELKTAGTRDPDILHATKANLIAAVKFPRMMGTYVMLMGGLLSLTIIGAFLGIPMLLAGWWLRRKGVRNIETVEAAYAEFTKAPAAAEPHFIGVGAGAQRQSASPTA